MFSRYATRIGNRIGAAVYTEALGEHMTIASQEYMDQGHDLARMLPGAIETVGLESEKTRGIIKKILKRQIDYGFGGPGAFYTGTAEGQDHYYEYARGIPDHDKLNVDKAIADPLLSMHYVNNLPGYEGMLLPGYHDDIIKELRAAKGPEELHKLYETKRVKDAFRQGSRIQLEESRQGRPIPEGAVLRIMSDLVICRGHTIVDGANILCLQTVRNSHTFDPGYAIHVLYKSNDGMVHTCIGIGTSPVPLMWSIANNVAAVAMWSVSGIPGVLSYIAETLGFDGVEAMLKEVGVEGLEKMLQAHDIINCFGNKAGLTNHSVVAYYRLLQIVKKMGDSVTEKYLDALWAAEAAMKNPDKESNTIQKNVEISEDAKTLAKIASGEMSLDLAEAYGKIKADSKIVPKDSPLAGGGTFLDKDGEVIKLADVNMAGGAVEVQSATASLYSTADPKLLESLVKLIDAKMPDHLTAQWWIETKREYQRLLEEYINKLPIEKRTDPRFVEQAVKHAFGPQTAVEEKLREVFNRIAPNVADGVVKERGIKAPAQQVLKLVLDSFMVNVWGYFFQKEDGPLKTWTEESALRYAISANADELREKARKEISQQQEDAARSLADFDAKHSKEVMERSEDLKRERKVLEERKEATDKAHGAAEDVEKDVEKRKKASEEHLKEIDKKNKEAPQRWPGGRK